MKVRSYKHWSTKQDVQLLNMKRSGMKYKEIAIELNRTSISVEKRYRKIIKENLYKVDSFK